MENLAVAVPAFSASVGYRSGESALRAAAIMGGYLRVPGSLALNHTHTIGGLRLFGAETGKNLNCEGASFRNGGGIALDCEHTKIGGSALLQNGFTSQDEIRFLNSTIDGTLDCHKTTCRNPGAVALNAHLIDDFRRSGSKLASPVR